MVESQQPTAQTVATPHSRWVRISHWIGTAGFLTLAFTGVIILMAHPRLYWGEVGNDLTPALIELPISRNHQHGGWEKRTPFFEQQASPVSASRTYDIFNKNGWGRSLHFLAAWVIVLTGLFYLLAGLFTGHFRRHLAPRLTELTPRQFWQDIREHLRLQIRAATGGPQYGLLQKCTYCVVVFLVLPLIVLTGLTMSPAITAAYPFLLNLFGGFQSARTIHFFAFVVLLLFLIVHLAMVIKSGFKRQIRAMTLGSKYENEKADNAS
ncbi:MAG TPA: cytochrome b/b6 domain-containing protein [Blastocatellia bacterium]|nr:cytochrome b/b6 domain-containing protein [Blastocatellia bacterium]